MLRHVTVSPPYSVQQTVYQMLRCRGLSECMQTLDMYSAAQVWQLEVLKEIEADEMSLEAGPEGEQQAEASQALKGRKEEHTRQYSLVQQV